ncbi:MAG: C1 family peptidase, partial [Candidatus Riflebacteria bacterium]
MKNFIYKLILTLSITFFLQPLFSQGLPASYDARVLNIVTPVKNQSPYGSCWSFSNLAACETNFLLQAYKAKEINNSLNIITPDYSERYLNWMAYANPLSENNSTKPYLDMNTEFATNNPATVYNKGGFDAFAAAFFHKGIGLVNESEAPYSNSYETIMEGISETIPAAITVTDSYNCDYYSSEFTHIQGEQKDRIKQLLLETGALSVGVYAEESWGDPNNYEYNFKE